VHTASAANGGDGGNDIGEGERKRCVGTASVADGVDGRGDNSFEGLRGGGDVRTASAADDADGRDDGGEGVRGGDVRTASATLAGEGRDDGGEGGRGGRIRTARAKDGGGGGCGGGSGVGDGGGEGGGGGRQSGGGNRRDVLRGAGWHHNHGSQMLVFPLPLPFPLIESTGSWLGIRAAPCLGRRSPLLLRLFRGMSTVAPSSGLGLPGGSRLSAMRNMRLEHFEADTTSTQIRDKSLIKCQRSTEHWNPERDPPRCRTQT
jgi:hypothetical protein